MMVRQPNHLRGLPNESIDQGGRPILVIRDGPAMWVVATLLVVMLILGVGVAISTRQAARESRQRDLTTAAALSKNNAEVMALTETVRAFEAELHNEEAQRENDRAWIVTTREKLIRWETQNDK